MSCFAVRQCILLLLSVNSPAVFQPQAAQTRGVIISVEVIRQEVKTAQNFLYSQSLLWWRAPQQREVVLEEDAAEHKDHTHVPLLVCVCVYRCVCKYSPLIWLTGAVSGVPGLSAPSQSSSGSVTSSPAQRSELPAWRPEPSAGRRSPPASPGPEQQGWVRTGLQQGAEQWVRASQGRNKTESLESPGTNEGKTFASRTFKGLLNHT